MSDSDKPLIQALDLYGNAIEFTEQLAKLLISAYKTQHLHVLRLQKELDRYMLCRSIDGSTGYEYYYCLHCKVYPPAYELKANAGSDSAQHLMDCPLYGETHG